MITAKLELMNLIEEKLTSNLPEYPTLDAVNKAYEYFNLVRNTLNSSTIDQVWRIYHKLVLQDLPIKILGGDSSDHLAYEYKGMYVAVLPDGSFHT